jgi:signal transduction histidine kinase
VTLRASRSVGVDGVSIVFEVLDTGIGMDTEQIGQLFQEFMQIDLSSEYHQGGTGLGLALSRQLCRLMGGDIVVVSQLHVGSTFTAIIPAHVAESADLAQTLRSST